MTDRRPKTKIASDSKVALSGKREPVRVKLLGGFSVSVGSRTIGQNEWRLRKAASLVKLFALAPGHRLHREQAMDLLWPNLARRAASNNLRRTLHAARKALDPTRGSHYLASEDESLVLCPSGELWVDAEAFEETAATARRARDPAAYRAALDLYAGDLLPGDRYEEWAGNRRDELRQLYVVLLAELAEGWSQIENLIGTCSEARSLRGWRVSMHATLGGASMITQDTVLVQLMRLIERIPTPPPPPRRPRGRPIFYSEKLFLKALLIMIIRRLHKVGELLAVLEENTPEMRGIRDLLSEGGRFPCRRTFERRLKALPERLPEQISCLGRHLVGLLSPWESSGRAVALDSTLLRARGGVWHKKDREAGVVPHTSIDTEAAWTKSGWHGWVYGWKLHLAITVSSVWIPLSARLTPADVADNQIAPVLIEELPDEARFVLGDTHYDAENVREKCEQTERFLVTSKRGRYPHTDSGVEVRRIFHKLRSFLANENFRASTSRASSRCTSRFPRRAASQHCALRSWGGVCLPVGSAPPS